MAGAGGGRSTTNAWTARATRTAWRPARLTSLSRLLAVCDVYASFCTARPHRPAKETRTALTDVLLMAENGLLDRDYAERLLESVLLPGRLGGGDGGRFAGAGGGGAVGARAT